MDIPNKSSNISTTISVISGILIVILMYHIITLIILSQISEVELFHMQRMSLILNFNGAVMTALPYIYAQRLKEGFSDLTTVNQGFTRIGIGFVLMGLFTLIVINYHEYGL